MNAGIRPVSLLVFSAAFISEQPERFFAPG
jgi:hypothetical protein